MEPTTSDVNLKNTDDPFEDILNLEDQYYKEGYDLGVTDGSRAGRIEGRIFGLEKGFDKFVEMGRLSGRAGVWNARLAKSSTVTGERASSSNNLPLKGSERLRRHVDRLRDLTDPETLSTENSEDAVAEFDERLRDAKAKALLISRIVGEDSGKSSAVDDSHAEEVKTPTGGLRVKRHDGGKQTREMEDFEGLPRFHKPSS